MTIERGARDVVLSKLIYATQAVEELRELLDGLSDEDYHGDRVAQRAVERLVQLIVESCSDAALRLLSAVRQRMPGSMRDSFRFAAANRFIEDGLAQIYADDYTSLRHSIVHAYEDVDNDFILESARALVDDATRFLAQMNAYIAQLREV